VKIANRSRFGWSERVTFLPLLPSGIAVIGIESWVERFTKIFQKALPDQEVRSSDLFTVKSWSQ
jgi:hypothetical protein